MFVVVVGFASLCVFVFRLYGGMLVVGVCCCCFLAHCVFVLCGSAPFFARLRRPITRGLHQREGPLLNYCNFVNLAI